MGCINDKQLKQKKNTIKQFKSKFPNSKNPIVRIAKQCDIQQLKQRWLDNQLEVLKKKLNTSDKQKNKTISRQTFVELLPSLAGLSQKTKKNLYDLFNFQQQIQLSVNSFVMAQLLILKNDEFDVLSDMFFYVYSSCPDKNILNNQDMELFRKQFKEHQLDYRHSLNRISKQSIIQTSLSMKAFRQVFQQYDIFSIRQWFRYDLKNQERIFKRYLQNQGINRNNKQRVYLIEFTWFMKWKTFFQYRNGNQIQIKQNDLQIHKSKTNKLQIFLKANPQILNQAKNLASDKQRILQPMNNFRIKGDQQEQLKQNCQQYQDFISVNQFVYQYFRLLYGGGPAIIKPYPHFYNKKLILVKLSNDSFRFKTGFATNIYNQPQQTFQQIYSKRKQKYNYKQAVQKLVLYYKCVGKFQWIKIQNLKSPIYQYPFLFKTFIVFVQKQKCQKFQEKYNITLIDKKRQINSRIKNFGSILNVQYEGILQQGHVANIFPNYILIYLKIKSGQLVRLQKSINELQKLNPKVLDEQLFQGLAGLQNIGNTCYINAPIQCLLRTPFFGEYLESRDVVNKQKQTITYELYKIFQNSKLSRDCIYMSKFKNKFDKIFPFFQGSLQHDAQQFLLILLDKLAQQQPIRSRIRISQSKLAQQGQKTKKAMNLFSGITEAQTSCLKCDNKGYSQQSFFTFSLSLPIIKEAIFTFYYMDQHFKIYKYCVDAIKEIQIHQIRQKISQKLKISQSNLLIMSVFQKQWMYNLKKINQMNRISSFLKYDTQIMCYKIEHQQDPDYDDFVDKRQSNSVKIEVRNRIYNQKAKCFKSFAFPFCVEISSRTTFKQLKQELNDKLVQFVNQQAFNKFNQAKQLSGSKGLSSNFQNSKSLLNSSENIYQINLSGQSQKSLGYSLKGGNGCPFYIRYIKNQDSRFSVCWFCQKNTSTKRQSQSLKYQCQNCQFEENQILYQNKKFIKNWKSLAISIDWLQQNITKIQQIKETQSCRQAERLQLSRRSHVQKLLKQNFQQEEKLQLKCQKQNCTSNEALRRQKIKLPPNILILHLKRFQYRDNDFYKLKNNIEIPQKLVLPGFYDKYSLYGNIVHYGNGTGRGGHYINYVKTNQKWFKCDDQKVFQTQSKSQHLNPQTYILFYKKDNIQKSFQALKI